jgi:nitrate reductase gamma subunit
MRSTLDLLLFIVLPYAAVALSVAGTIERYHRHSFSVTSLSSQFFENRRHFWGVMPFHLGILTVLAAHLVWFLAPRLVLSWNRSPTRLHALEIVMLAAGVSALAGLVVAVVRRGADAKLRKVTSVWDWLVYALLAGQLLVGVLVALRYSWGTSWFAAIVSPYLWSLVRLNPDAAAIGALPWLVQAHVVGAYLLVAVFPYSRLVHVFATPNPYLWRPPQVVRWRWRPQAAGRRAA